MASDLPNTAPSNILKRRKRSPLRTADASLYGRMFVCILCKENQHVRKKIRIASPAPPPTYLCWIYPVLSGALSIFLEMRRQNMLNKYMGVHLQASQIQVYQLNESRFIILYLLSQMHPGDLSTCPKQFCMWNWVVTEVVLNWSLCVRVCIFLPLLLLLFFPCLLVKCPNFLHARPLSSVSY